MREFSQERRVRPSLGIWPTQQRQYLAFGIWRLGLALGYPVAPHVDVRCSCGVGTLSEDSDGISGAIRPNIRDASKFPATLAWLKLIDRERAAVGVVCFAHHLDRPLNIVSEISSQTHLAAAELHIRSVLRDKAIVAQIHLGGD